MPTLSTLRRTYTNPDEPPVLKKKQLLLPVGLRSSDPSSAHQMSKTVKSEEEWDTYDSTNI